MWELDHKEGWAPKNWCFWTVVFLKTLESFLDCKEIKPVNPKGCQPWICTRRTDAEAEAPILWQPDAKSWLVRKDPDAKKHWGQEEKGVTEDEMVGWHHQINGHEFEQALGDSKGQGSLVCCSPWRLQKVRQVWVTEQQQWLLNFLEICHFKALSLYSSYLINNLTLKQICVKQRKKKQLKKLEFVLQFHPSH